MSVHSVHTTCKLISSADRNVSPKQSYQRACLVSRRPRYDGLGLCGARSTYLKRLRTRFGGRGVGAGRTREARLGSISKWLSGDTCRGGRICFLFVHCIAFGGWAGWLAGWLAHPILSFRGTNRRQFTFHLLLCFVSLWWRDDTPGDVQLLQIQTI